MTAAGNTKVEIGWVISKKKTKGCMVNNGKLPMAPDFESDLGPKPTKNAQSARYYGYRRPVVLVTGQVSVEAFCKSVISLGQQVRINEEKNVFAICSDDLARNHYEKESAETVLLCDSENKHLSEPQENYPTTVSALCMTNVWECY